MNATKPAAKFTAAQTAALLYFSQAPGERSGKGPNGHAINSLSGQFNQPVRLVIWDRAKKAYVLTPEGVTVAETLARV